MSAAGPSLPKRLELAGRRVLVWLLGVLLGVEKRAVALGDAPRILVVRLDERLGNVVMLTPLLASLRARFPQARLELLGSERNLALCGSHSSLSQYLVFDKRALFARHGPLRTVVELRRRRFDLALDGANPTDPSATQALLVAFSGATHTVGFDVGDFSRLYTATVSGARAGVHEIDMRLALLAALPGAARVRSTSLVAPPLALGSPLAALAASSFAVLNIGARLADKRLDAAAYALLASLLCDTAQRCVVTYGPAEATLAREVVAGEGRAELAPPTSSVELAALMARASLVITCDTGPMHVAVAVGTPTCGLFVSTEPERYGYAEPPHAVVDVRGRAVAAWLAEVEAWVRGSGRDVVVDG